MNTTKEWTMTYSGPQLMLTTKYGAAEVTFTSAGHAHVSAYCDGRPGTIEYRGRHWHVSMHAYATHGWNEEPPNGTYRHAFSDSRGKNAPPTFRKAITEAITEAISSFTAAHPEILRDAQRNHVANDLQRSRKKWREAQHAADQAWADVARLTAELNQLEI